MVVKCYVTLLDGTQAEFEVDKRAKASVLIDNVCERINILEKHYFGLLCKRSDLQRCWLNLEKKIRKQVHKSGRLEFEFAVKFYPSDPTLLQEGITRYQLCLQIREDLKSHLECCIDKLADLICFWLKSDYQGIDITSQMVADCLKEIGKTDTKESRPELIDRVLTLIQASSNLSSARADEQFVMTAASLRLYGVHFYKGKESSGNDILIGISSKGVTEKRKDQIPVLHSWSHIKNIKYDKCKFKIKLVKSPANGDPRLKKSFIFDSEEQVQLIWKSAIDHHVFFRVGDKKSDKQPKRKGSILRRLSSKKKKSITEFDAQEESKSIKRKPPNVTRVNSIRAATPKPTPAPEETSVENGIDSGTLESDNAPETAPRSTETLSAEKLSKLLTGELDFAGPLAMPYPGNEYAAIDEKMPLNPNEEEREYTDDDIVDIIHGKPDGGSANWGSSTLFFTDPIVEADEEDHAYAVPSPRKTVYCDSRNADEDSNDDVMRQSAKDDPPEFVDDLDQYGEEWEDLSVRVDPTPKKDVRFVTNDASCDEDDDSSIEIPHSFVTSEENRNAPVCELPQDMSDSEDLTATTDATTQISTTYAYPTAIGESSIVGSEIVTIKEYVPRARKDSTEESESVEESDLEQGFDSPDTGAAFDRKTESKATDKSPSTNIVRPEDDDEQYTSDIDKPTSPEDMGHQKDSTESSNDSTNARSSLSSPLLSNKKEPIYRKSARSLGMDFRAGDAYKPINSAKGSDKVIDGGASTTAATIGDEDDFSMHELDEDSLYGHDYSNSEENEEDGAKASDHSDDDIDRSASHDDLLRHPAPLDTANQSLKDVELLGPKLPDRNQDGAASTTAATIGEEDDLSLEELDDDIMDEEVSAESSDKGVLAVLGEDITNENEVEPGFAMAKTDSDSKYSSISNVSGDTDELLDIDALEKAWRKGAMLDEEDELFRVLFRSPPKRKPRNKSEINMNDVKRGRQQAMAFRSGIDEEPISPRRRENLCKRPFIPSWPFDPMAILTSDELDNLDSNALEAAIAAQMWLLDGEKRLEEMEMMGYNASAIDDEEMTNEDIQIEMTRSPRNLGLAEKVEVRSRSPSASPRMVGEEFIPGVPDFVHSVVPYQLPTPVQDTDSTTLPEMDGSSGQCLQESFSPEKNYNCEKPAEDSLTANDITSASDRENDSKIDRPVMSNAGQPTASSGRSTPSGNNSLSEGTSSSTSKSSGSSFPRFVHSVFPLRRRSDERGRSKTRRKREKKITKQKNKKVARSKSRDKKVKKNVPFIEVTSAPHVEVFKAFPVVSSAPMSSELTQSLIDGDEDTKTEPIDTPRRLYDQESLDKITLSDSDDAHSKPEMTTAVDPTRC